MEITFGSSYQDVFKIKGSRNWEGKYNFMDVKKIHVHVYFIWLSLAYVAGGFVGAGEEKKEGKERGKSW